MSPSKATISESVIRNALYASPAALRNAPFHVLSPNGTHQPLLVQEATNYHPQNRSVQLQFATKIRSASREGEGFSHHSPLGLRSCPWKREMILVAVLPNMVTLCLGVVLRVPPTISRSFGKVSHVILQNDVLNARLHLVPFGSQ